MILSDSPLKRISIRFVLVAMMVCAFCLCKASPSSSRASADDSPSQAGESVPQDVEQLWRDFDPAAEALETEVLHEWNESGVTMRVVRFRVGVWKGQVARVAAVYGFPQGQLALPGLVQIHGGGQYADSNAVLTNAKRGYATLSIAWAGRINSPPYRVGPDQVRAFWAGEKTDPQFRLTTDWGAVDGYHAPSRFQATVFPSVRPNEWTIDAVESPRNSGWYLCAIAARRALTFLERQPEVDRHRLGVYGHSMGGKITVLAAIDPRVKAAAPSCGGVSDRYNKSVLFDRTLGDANYLRRIRCPIIFLSPANDFHGRIDDLQLAVDELKTKQWRMSCAPHHNHQDTSSYEVSTQVWFDSILKRKSGVPETPDLRLAVSDEPGTLMAIVTPDRSLPIEAVDFFFSRHGQMPGDEQDRQNTIARFWHHSDSMSRDGEWVGKLVLSGDQRPLWVFANVRYRLPEPIRGAGYYYRDYEAESVTLSSRMLIRLPETLRDAGVPHEIRTQAIIEDFEGDWQKEWFSYREDEWPVRTHKVYSEHYGGSQRSITTLS